MPDYIWYVITLLIAILVVTLLPWIIKLFVLAFVKTNYSKLGSSSRVRHVNEISSAVTYLSKLKIGALISIKNKQSLDGHRTDGVLLDANISSSLIISVFSKKSPLHDGAIIIANNKIKYAATFYKITNKSMDNNYGARHRAAIGISEQTDAITIVVSEQTGDVSIVREGKITKIQLLEFKEKLALELDN